MFGSNGLHKKKEDANDGDDPEDGKYMQIGNQWYRKLGGAWRLQAFGPADSD